MSVGDRAEAQAEQAICEAFATLAWESCETDAAGSNLGEIGGFDLAIDGSTPIQIEEARTFAEAGLLTGNHGVVVDLADGQQFQITIVRSR